VKTRTTKRMATLLAALSLTALLGAACGDDEGDAAAADPTTTEVQASDAGASGDADGTSRPVDSEDYDDGSLVEVKLVDYKFEGLPDMVRAGTKLTVSNESDNEMHELVAIRIPDEEKRPVSELVQLPEEELGKVFGGEPEPAAVLVAMPQSHESMQAVGDGTLTEPGRYAILCFIPQGAEPNADPTAGPPQGDGPPHAMLGMQAELLVE
jgi:hypothetical protein